jgi:hypothetical protein
VTAVTAACRRANTGKAAGDAPAPSSESAGHWGRCAFCGRLQCEIALDSPESAFFEFLERYTHGLSSGLSWSGLGYPYPLSFIPYPLSPIPYPLSPIPYPLSSNSRSSGRQRERAWQRRS